ncbi:MAG: di-heme oxidoredictase family protein, partial [Microthrixaceae bacterium]
MRHPGLATSIALVVVLAASCTGGGHTSPSTSPADDRPADDLELSGGAATVHNTGANAFAQSAPGLSSEERRAFVVGNNFFNDNWVTAPSSTTGRDGLGPLFNAQSCSSCHFKDGRGAPPAGPGEP